MFCVEPMAILCRFCNWRERGRGLEELLVGWMRPRVVDQITVLALWEAWGRIRAPTTGKEVADGLGDVGGSDYTEWCLRRGEVRKWAGNCLQGHL